VLKTKQKKGNIVMKKTYMIPTTSIVRVETQQMIAGTMTVDGTKTISNSNQILSRGRNSDWDDED
jgi:hypothetical protein